MFVHNYCKNQNFILTIFTIQMDIQAASPGTLVNRLYINLPYYQTLMMEHLFVLFLLCMQQICSRTQFSTPNKSKEKQRDTLAGVHMWRVYVSLHANTEYDKNTII